MALVRVYCGLASAPSAVNTRGSTCAWLTAAVVDDAGRLLDVCDIRDDPVGYAELGALVSERSGGTAGVAVSADSGEHQITLLLAAAGRPLAIAEEDQLDDYADQFGDDDAPDEIQASVSERRAVGLARALQAGALDASVHGAPRELMALKPVLAAHAALATGRQGAAVALREVLRELYPAALRAYTDPAEPIPLAILDALPEPGQLAPGTNTRGRDAEVVAELVAAGVADRETLTEAITSLRLAISETPRRAGIGKTLTTAVAETIRQAVAAVRACDGGITALVGLLTEKATPASTLARTFPVRQRPAQPPASPLRAVREAAGEPVPGPARPVPAAPGGPPTLSTPLPARPTVGRADPASLEPAAATGYDYPAADYPAADYPAADYPAADYPAAPAAPAAVAAMSAPRPGSRPEARPLDDVPPLVERRADIPPPTERSAEAPKLAPNIPAPGSRTDWPLNTNAANLSDQAVIADEGYPGVRTGESVLIPQQPGRVPPPWQTDDLPGEPPSLRLVEQEQLREPKFDYDMPRGSWPTDEPVYDAPPLRLVEPNWPGTDALDSPINPAANDSDGDLLIFAQASAWFTGQTGENPPVSWSNPADAGWQAAERATTDPVTEDETTAGLPRRVPQANLVPGSALPQAERPLRIVRDPKTMAQHTTGYFRGSRRGEEVRGFAVGGRPGREAAAGWDFSREGWETVEQDSDSGYEYRPAARR